jgi:3-methylfumaryl-CoA hydratase
MDMNPGRWLGRTEVAEEKAEFWPARGLAALMDRPFEVGPGDPIPSLGHWTYFTPMVLQSKIGFDGHPQRGGFIPSIAQPRRMWAASDITFHAPIRFGDTIEKTAEISDLSDKDGVTGTLIFLKINNVYRVDGEVRLTEEQTIVYRDPPGAGEAPRSKPVPDNPEWSVEVETPATRIFRYSAVTFNAHQIHYDHPYVTGEEGYPGIIVQGQFIATMLLDAFEMSNPDMVMKKFSFRAVKPIFSGERFFAEGNLSGDKPALWARGENGDMRMMAKIEF